MSGLKDDNVGDIIPIPYRVEQVYSRRIAFLKDVSLRRVPDVTTYFLASHREYEVIGV